MTFSSPGRLKQLTAWAFLVLVGMGSVAPSPARAACGNNAGSHPSRSSLQLLHDLGLEKTTNPERFDSTSEVPRGDRPCSGLTCSRGRDLPTAPAAPASSLVRSDDGCCTTAQTEYSGAEVTNYQSNPVNPHPQHTSSPVERPPRR